jgi:hypothetical protein
MNKISRVVSIVLVFGLIMAGCCTKVGTDGKTTKSFSNCLDSVQNVVCTPTTAVIDVVTAGVTIIEVIIGSAIPGSAVFIAATDAKTVAGYILKGSCVTFEQFDKLISFLSSDTFKTAQVKMAPKTGLKAAVPVKTVDVKVLTDWRNGVK